MRWVVGGAGWEVVDGGNDFGSQNTLLLVKLIRPQPRIYNTDRTPIYCSGAALEVWRSLRRPATNPSKGKTRLSHHPHNFNAAPPSSPPPRAPDDSPSPLFKCRLAPCSVLAEADFLRNQVARRLGVTDINQESLCLTRCSKRNSSAARYVVYTHACSSPSADSRHNLVCCLDYVSVCSLCFVIWPTHKIGRAHV